MQNAKTKKEETHTHKRKNWLRVAWLKTKKSTGPHAAAWYSRPKISGTSLIVTSNAPLRAVVRWSPDPRTRQSETSRTAVRECPNGRNLVSGIW